MPEFLQNPSQTNHLDVEPCCQAISQDVVKLFLYTSIPPSNSSFLSTLLLVDMRIFTERFFETSNGVAAGPAISLRLSGASK